MRGKEIKIIIFILMFLVLGFNILIAQEENQTLRENSSKNIGPPPSSQLPEVSPAHPLEKKQESPQSSFVLSEPVIANPSEEE